MKLSEFDYLHLSNQRKITFEKLNTTKQNQIRDSHENQRLFISNLKKKSKKIGLEICFIDEREMRSIQPGKKDLVLSCGGDGTFLSCAQHYQTSILLGMNSDYKPRGGLGSYGALTTTNRINLEEHLQNLVDSAFEIDYWNRLQVEINGKLIDRYAVNDIYFGQEISYQTCNISILQSGIEQSFNCSGVLCCTGMGSHAWYYNAGGSPFSNDLDAFGFSILFPNLKRSLEFSCGIISSKQKLVMVPEGDDYILSFDSKPDVIKTELGDEIKITLAPNKAIRVISFYNKEK